MDLSPDQIKQMIQMLQTMLDANDTSTQDNPITNIKTKTTKTNNKKYQNKFLAMSEKDMHKEDTLIDKKLSVVDPVLRNRPTATVDIKCRICGKTETVNINMIGDRDRYKCNKCAISAG